MFAFIFKKAEYLKLETALSSENSVKFQVVTWCASPKDDFIYSLDCKPWKCKSMDYKILAWREENHEVFVVMSGTVHMDKILTMTSAERHDSIYVKGTL
jgi:hypothetical protein